MEESRAKIIGISRHRLTTDGEGVTTLVAFHGCTLKCRYCLNPHSLVDDNLFPYYSPEELYDITRIDELYFLATNGGVTFGGGEPGLHSDFIRKFRELCGPDWNLTLETSLNVPEYNIAGLIPVVNSFIIDIKDLNPQIFASYTDKSNSLVLTNLHRLASASLQSRCLLRLPLIPGYNNISDRESSRKFLEDLGYNQFDLFTYKTR